MFSCCDLEEVDLHLALNVWSTSGVGYERLRQIWAKFYNPLLTCVTQLQIVSLLNSECGCVSCPRKWSYSDLKVENLGPSAILDLSRSWFSKFCSNRGLITHHDIDNFQRNRAILNYWWLSEFFAGVTWCCDLDLCPLTLERL